uniref:Exocyst complex component Sec8 n=1 Tax=Amphiprion ocellaris TaxID=80972 RepID=A0AAQ5ZTT7_AMPOC
MAADTGRYRSAVSKNKDPSGLLISVIRTLSSSDDVQDRETEKGRLEEAFETCDRDLDELIVQHYAELTTAIRTYQSITERITSSRNKIKQVKENLLSCKMLLHCKRDELRKLWIEGIEHKHVLQLLDDIENIKQVPQRLEAYMASKHYLHATDMLVKAVESLEGPLLQVEGLGDLRLELHSKKLNIHLVLIDELHRHLYIKSTSRLGPFKMTHVIKHRYSSPMPVLDISSLSTPRKLLDSSQFSTPGSGSVRELQQDMRELSQADLPEVDPEENSAEFMGILIRALAKLKKLPETIKAIMDRLEPELKQIVKRSTTQIADHAYQRGENLAQESQPRLLLELLELLIDKFKAVAQAHSVVLAHLQQIAVQCPGGTHEEDIKLYDQADVSAKIQTVLQVLLMEYLDVKNSRSATEPSAQLSYASTGSEFAAFFAKKKPQRAKQSLFKFESSSHAISMSAYLREQRRELYSKSGELQGGADDNLIEGGEMKFVCKPGARNITVIFQPLLRFIQEIEMNMGPGQAKQCQLRAFLTYYINDLFLNQVRTEINKEIEAVSKTADPLKILASADTMKLLGVQRPLLQSTVVVEKSIQDLMSLMQDLSAYSNQFLEMVCDKLKEYKEICNTAYRGIVQCEEKLTISASWSKDEDISRLLQSLPNWANMAQPRQTRQKREDEEDFTRAAFAKESEVLTGNLGDKLIPQNEILRDVSDLKALANLHESMEWLAARLKMFFANLPRASSNGLQEHTDMNLLTQEEQILQTLSDLSRGFQDIADRCLLVLHLEVRVHCFHYLIPLTKQGNYAIVANVESMDYDPLVVKLNKDISAIEEAMGAALQQHKFQYIFEGLGHLISCILINGAQYFKRISESGIKKMCRNIFVLQQNLTNITMSRESDLDFARQYYEMLYNTADELLNLVVDQGVRYTELEYINALSLLHRSQTGVGDLSTQNIRLQRLKEIICEQAAIKQATKDKKITTV